MKYLKAILLWFFLLIIISILVDNFLISIFIVPESEYRQTFLKIKNDLVYSFSFFASFLICPFFYKSFRKGIHNISDWNIFAVIFYSCLLVIVIIWFFGNIEIYKLFQL